ncbi:MAG: BNR-4 repeat-containing protein, partial [Verrucomicrobia bacterium]|nr:BNR-4 repeat-containing protein [Verrucomicrobiota bacterium]
MTTFQQRPVLPRFFGAICLGVTLCAATAQAQTSFLWTNAVSGDWSGAANWSNNLAPPVGGRTNLALAFLAPGGYSATNNLAGVFTNNQLTLNSPTAAGTLRGNPLRFVSNGATAPTLMQQGAADFSIANAVTLASTLGVSLNGAGTVALTGTLDGAGGITLQGGGSGALTLARSNSFSGVVRLNAGTLIAAHSFALGTTASQTVAAGGTATSRLGLEGGIALVEPVRLGGRQPLPNASALAAHVINLGGTNSLTGDLTGDTGGNQYNVESAAGLLVVAGNYSQFNGTGGRFLNLQGAGDARWAGAINDGTANICLTKRGSGRWILAGTNTYTGPTLVTEGTLLVNGISGGNTVTVTNATLGGAGVVGGATTLQDGSVLAPGNGLVTLTISNYLMLGAGSSTVMEVSHSPFTNDVVRVTGVLTFGGTLVVTNAGPAPLAVGDDFQLFIFTGSDGGFATVNLPALTNGLSWDTSLLATAGRVRVVADSDGDGDGLPDAWEIQYFTNLLQTATGDPDVDGFNNLAEYLAGSNPTNLLSTPNDLDADGLPDAWELQHFGNLAQTGSGDPDGDGYSNAAELAAGSNPANALSTLADIDGDGLPDAWEMANFGNLSQTTNGDPDGDWMTNLQEYQAGTVPTDPRSKLPGPRVRLQWVDDGNPDTSEYAYPGSINTASFIRSSIRTVGNQQFLTYYGRHQSDAAYGFNNKLWVARRTVDSDLWQVFRTGFTANNITDGHDCISFGIDGNDFMHISWGMHADAYHYAKSLTPVTGTNVIAFGPDGTMTGKENSVTYPQFLNLPNGDLLYVFREGGSGNGDLFLNRYRIASQTWTNVHLTGNSQLSFIKGTGWTPNYNAYWQQPCVNAAGNIFLIWTWRYNSDSPAREVGYQTNHDYDYAWSPDEGVTWKRSSGVNYVLPINERGENGNTNSIAEKVLSIPEGSSLMNQSGMCLDRSGQPVLANWWAPGASTNNHRRQYMVAFPDTNGWEVRQVSFRTIDSPTNKVPETALGDMGRPTIVCDRDDRLIVIYRDNEGASGLTVVHTLPKALDPQRRVWTQFDLTTKNLTGFDAP